MRQAVLVGVWMVIGTLGYLKVGYCYDVITVVNGGSLTGTVQFRGTRPPQEILEISKDQNVCGKTTKVNESLLVGDDLGVQNAVVSLVNVKRGKAFPVKKVTLDQRECRYTPHVLLVPVGAEVSILNNDGILHNIRTQSSTNPPINKPQPKFKKVLKEVFVAPEVIPVTCDAHAWMRGWLIVMDHPYFAITDSHGRYQLENIPEGDYQVKVWHPTFPVQTREIHIAPKTASVQKFELAP